MTKSLAGNSRTGSKETVKVRKLSGLIVYIDIIVEPIVPNGGMMATIVIVGIKEPVMPLGCVITIWSGDIIIDAIMPNGIITSSKGA
jgi:hypothetical protein